MALAIAFSDTTSDVQEVPRLSCLKATIARNHVEMAGLSHAVTVQLGHSDDAVQMVLDRYGAHSVDMATWNGVWGGPGMAEVFMDQRGTAFHDDLRTLEELKLLAENAVVVAEPLAHLWITYSIT